MVSNRNFQPVGVPRILKIVCVILGSIYLALGILQIMVSTEVINDPSGVLDNDLVGAFVLLVISSTFWAGALFSGGKAGDIRSYFMVGAFLAVVQGITGLLISLSNLFSELIGTGNGGSDLLDFAEPSIILAFIIILSVLVWKYVRSGPDIRRAK